MASRWSNCNRGGGFLAGFNVSPAAPAGGLGVRRRRADDVGNAWYVHPLTADVGEWLQREGFSLPRDRAPSTAPSPEQVFAALRLFPEYHVRVRREDRNKKEMGQDVVFELTREDGSHAISIRLLGVSSDDRPAGVFVFDYYRGTEELVRLVARLAELCGPLFLYDDSGCEKPIVVSSGWPAGPGGTGGGSRGLGFS
jgi:hypothetical protein